MIHPAARSYEGASERYERGRPSYPEAAVALLGDVLGLEPGVVAVELGAGTGKLTRLLVPSGARLVAVEPVAAMRRRLQEAVPSATPVGGVAESLPFAGASVGAVVAAQSFHWFRSAEAANEAGSVLWPGGRVGLVWNIRDDTVEWVRALNELVDRHEGEVPRFRTGAWRAPFVDDDGPFTALEERQFHHSDPTDAERLVARVLSTSFIAALPPGAQDDLAAEVHRLVEGFPRRFDLPHRTHLYWCRRR